MIPSGSDRISAEDFSELADLVKNGILKMPEDSILWTPGYTADQIRRIVAMVTGMEISRDNFRIDKVELKGGRTILGKGIVKAVGLKYPGKESEYHGKMGEAVIICPKCFELDNTGKVPAFKRHSIIYTSDGLDLKYEQTNAETDEEIPGEARLLLSCASPKGCKEVIKLRPNIPASLGQYGGVDLTRYL